jgi:hypothetical protein
MEEVVVDIPRRRRWSGLKSDSAERLERGKAGFWLKRAAVTGNTSTRFGWDV